MIRRSRLSSSPSSPLASFKAVVLLLWVQFTSRRAQCQQFNLEVEKRVLDRLESFFHTTVKTTDYILKLQESGVFESNLTQASDRDDFLVHASSISKTLVSFGSKVYFGSEQGMFNLVDDYSSVYREPGESGYDLADAAKQKYMRTCLSENGQVQFCLHKAGENYIQKPSACLSDPDAPGCWEPCSDAASQRDCSTLADNEEKLKCQDEVKWCASYSIQEIQEGDEGKGYIPSTQYCNDARGYITETEGKVLSDGKLGNCYHRDGTTPVNRRIEGDYEYCKSKRGDVCQDIFQDEASNSVCDTTFLGGFSESNYDPRYRPWYINTKRLQSANWVKPYAFHTLGLGITYSQPYWNTLPDGRNSFAGVIAVDYLLEDITSFLVDAYGDSTTIDVLIVETQEPYYVIGSSTGSPASVNRLKSNLTEVCPFKVGTDNAPCVPVRVPISEYTQTKTDRLLGKSFARHMEAGFPKDLLSVTLGDDIDSEFYVSQSSTFDAQADAGLEWRIIIESPGQRSTADTITLENGVRLLVAVVAIASLGVIVCGIFFFYIYRKRNERAITLSDWRFTLAFIFGCLLMNGSSYFLLGENTEVMCLIRPCTLHFFFVAALAPLLVKVWRINALVGSRKIRIKRISNRKAALYTTPLIIIQVVILVILSFADPPKPTEIITNGNGAVVQSIVCEADTVAFAATVFLYEGALVFLGCYLAYKSRNLNDDFNEVKPMVFSMYNVAFVGIIMLMIIEFGGLNGKEQAVVQAIGVFWVATGSASAFVLPRMIAAEQVIRDKKAGISNRESRVRVSGLLHSVLSDDSHDFHFDQPSNDFHGHQSHDFHMETTSTSISAVTTDATPPLENAKSHSIRCIEEAAEEEEEESGFADEEAGLETRKIEEIGISKGDEALADTTLESDHSSETDEVSSSKNADGTVESQIPSLVSSRGATNAGSTRELVSI